MGGNGDDDGREAEHHPASVHDAATARAHERQRLENFQAKCAAMREKTAAELVRLEKKRSDTRLNIGITPERMAQWLEEHQQMLQQAQTGDP